MPSEKHLPRLQQRHLQNTHPKKPSDGIRVPYFATPSGASKRKPSASCQQKADNVQKPKSRRIPRRCPPPDD
ncbi:hypothetical protein ACR30T_03110 [Neisseria gonorrhoeae]